MEKKTIYTLIGRELKVTDYMAESFEGKPSYEDIKDKILRIRNKEEEEGVKSLLDEKIPYCSFPDIVVFLRSIDIPSTMKNYSLKMFSSLWMNEEDFRFEDIDKIVSNEGLEIVSEIIDSVRCGTLIVKKINDEEASYYIKRGESLVNVSGYIYAYSLAGQLLDKDAKRTDYALQGNSIRSCSPEKVILKFSEKVGHEIKKPIYSEI